MGKQKISDYFLKEYLRDDGFNEKEKENGVKLRNASRFSGGRDIKVLQVLVACGVV